MINRFKVKAEIFIQGSVEMDVFSGFTIGLKSVGKVNGYLTKTTENLTVENGRIVSKTVTKLYTTESVPHDTTLIKVNGTSYDVLSFIDYDKVRVLSLTEVNDG